MKDPPARPGTRVCAIFSKDLCAGLYGVVFLPAAIPTALNAIRRSVQLGPSTAQRPGFHHHLPGLRCGEDGNNADRRLPVFL
jgi:hypothetical protein